MSKVFDVFAYRLKLQSGIHIALSYSWLLEHAHKASSSVTSCINLFYLILHAVRCYPSPVNMSCVNFDWMMKGHIIGQSPTFHQFIKKLNLLL